MIRYKNDYVTLVDDSGRTQGPMDPGYFDMLQTLSKQQDAVSQNNAAAVDYRTKLDAYQLSVDAGRGNGLVPPVKPKFKVVADNGVESETDFVPPLPDPKPQVPIVPGGPLGKPPVLSTDDLGRKLDIVLSLLTNLVKLASTK